jgi:hypothetical protein
LPVKGVGFRRPVKGCVVVAVVVGADVAVKGAEKPEDRLRGAALGSAMVGLRLVLGAKHEAFIRA